MGPFGPHPKLPGNIYWAFGPKVGLRPTKDCIEEGEGKALPLQKIIFSHLFCEGGSYKIAFLVEKNKVF